MRLPLPRTRLAYTSLLTCALLLISAFAPLPLPLSMVNKAIALRAPELQLKAAGATITWGRGEISLLDVRLLHHQRDRLRIDRLDVALDLWPGSDAFGKPIRLQIVEADGQLEQTVVDSLAKLQSSDSSPFPLAIEVRDSALRWTDTNQLDYLIGDVRAHGHMSPEGARFEVHGAMSLPGSGHFELRLDAGKGLHAWRVDFKANAEFVKDWGNLAAKGLLLEGAQVDFQLHAEGFGTEIQELIVDGSSSVASFTADYPRLAISDVTTRFNGSLETGLRVEAEGVEAHAGFALNLLATLDEQYQPNIHLQASTNSGEVKAETLTWLSELLPDVGEIVTALEPRGQPVTSFDCNWNEASGLVWSLHVDPNDTSITYRGIPDESGNRFSFPYPARNSQGSVVACQDAVLFYGAAEIGGTGNAAATGIIDFRNDGFLAIDIRAEHVPLDERISYAMTGNPVIASLWRELGSPQQGVADVSVELRFQEQEFHVRVAGDASGIDVLPARLPVRAEIDHAWFEWVPGIARFGASMNTLGGGLWLDGNVRDVANRDVPDLRLTLRGRGFNATQSELRILESYLPLPKGLSQFELSGDVFYNLHLVQPLDDSPGHISGLLRAEEAHLNWPALGLEFTHLNAIAGFAGHGEDMQIGVARSWSQVDGGTLNGSLSMSSAKHASEVVIEGRELKLSSELLSKLQALSGQQPWGGRMDWSGSLDMLAQVNPFHPDVINAHFDFHPLQIGVPREGEDVSFELQGRVGVQGVMTATGSNFPQFSSRTLTFTGPDVDLAVYDLSAHFDSAGLQLQATVGSSAGISLSSRLPLLVDEETMLALEKIGLRGTLRSRNLSIDATLPSSGPIRLGAHGSLLVENVRLTGGATRLTDGYAEIEVREASWNGSQSFHADFSMSCGNAKVGGLALQNATAQVTLTPESVIWRDVNAEMLGGHLHTNGMEPDGTEIRGSMRLDFDPSAPVAAEYFVTGLQLERMRDELGLGGPLAGEVNGYVKLAIPSTSPTFAKGRGWLHINGGALGTVPVLKSIFRFAGISPPIFDEGDIRFRLDGLGKLDIDEFSLQHPLLRVTGKGSMTMDTRLRLKVTLRTFGFVGRLPILKDLIDFLIEQQVYGPVEAPIITHRASGKLFGDDFTPPPFPLWVPGAAKPDWRISPIFPVE